MRAVSNTSPVSNLAIIGRLDLLQERYASLTIPTEVLRELRALSHVAAREAIEAALRQGWLRAETLPIPNEYELLRTSLDAGEAQAIALAIATSADVLLIDERRGREKARDHGLKVAGVLGELLYAKYSGLIPSVRTEVERLRTEAYFFIHADIEAFILAQAGE